MSSNSIDKLMTSLSALPSGDSDDILLDKDYIKQSYHMVTDALQKGFDVAQLPDGEIYITEVKTVTSRYSWNTSGASFDKTRTGSKVKRKPRRKKLEAVPQVKVAEAVS
jgi:hypothetical protein